MHLFTCVQLVCLAALWAVMSTQASLAFPFVLILTVPVKMFLLTRIFTGREIACVSCNHKRAQYVTLSTCTAASDAAVLQKNIKLVNYKKRGLFLRHSGNCRTFLY